MNFLGAPFIIELTNVNGVYHYNLAPYFSIGGGAGILSMTSGHSVGIIMGSAFVRLKLEVPSWKVSPFVLADGGINVYFANRDDLFRPISNFIVGARFRLRNNGHILFGGGFYTLWNQGGCVPFSPIPVLHLGYTF